jgi:hypothetical protein
MAVQIFSIASGQLSTSAASSIYTSPTSPSPLTTIIKSIRLVNTASTPTTVNLYIFRSPDNTNRRIAPQNMSIPAGGLAIDDQEITMSSGDVIKGDASAAAVDFSISGIQR